MRDISWPPMNADERRWPAATVGAGDCRPPRMIRDRTAPLRARPKGRVRRRQPRGPWPGGTVYAGGHFRGSRDGHRALRFGAFRSLAVKSIRRFFFRSTSSMTVAAQNASRPPGRFLLPSAGRRPYAVHRRQTSLLWSAALLLFASNLIAGSLEDGIVAFNEGRYSTALL
jgi:hypothetical protein